MKNIENKSAESTPKGISKTKLALLALIATVGSVVASCTGEKDKDDFKEVPEQTIEGLTDAQKKMLREEVEKKFNDPYLDGISQSIKDEILEGIKNGTLDLSQYLQVEDEDAEKGMLGLAQTQQENMTLKSVIDNNPYINQNGEVTKRVLAEFWKKVESGEISGGAEVMFNDYLIPMLDAAGVDRFGEK